MGCSPSTPGDGATEPAAQPPGEDRSPPLDGRAFADMMMGFMKKNPAGPTERQGKLLEYIKKQSTPADEGDSKSNTTPRQYAAQRRLVLWLMFIIHRLKVNQQQFPGDAVMTMRVKDRRRRAQLKDEAEKRIYDQVMKLLIAPGTATFLDAHYQPTNQTNQGLADAFKELAQRVPDAPDIPDEPPKLGVWMMAGKVAELTIEAYGGGLWGLLTSCLKLAEIVKRWSARSNELVAWRAFAEAHRGMAESARALIDMADNMRIGLNPTISNEVKMSLKIWIGSVQGVVESLCKGVEAAIANANTNSDDLTRLMAKSTFEVMEKRAQMNVELVRAKQQCATNARIDLLVEHFVKLDTELKESLKTLKDNALPMDQIDKALEKVLQEYQVSRAKGSGSGAAADASAAAAPQNAPAAGSAAPTPNAPPAPAPVPASAAGASTDTSAAAASQGVAPATGNAAPTPTAPSAPAPAPASAADASTDTSAAAASQDVAPATGNAAPTPTAPSAPAPAPASAAGASTDTSAAAASQDVAPATGNAAPTPTAASASAAATSAAVPRGQRRK